jgi:flagellin
MSLVINTNTIANSVQRNLSANQANLSKSLARLSSGSKIVDPTDDAGGLAVSMKLAAALNRNVRTQQNVQNGISFLQTQDGAYANAAKILDRMSELKTMSLDVTKNSNDIANYDAEFTQLQQQLVNIQNEQFNGINLFDVSGSLTIYTTEKGDTASAPTVTASRIGLFDQLQGSGSYGGSTGENAVVNYNDSTAHAIGAIVKGIDATGTEQVAVVNTATAGSGATSFADELAAGNLTILNNSIDPHSDVYLASETYDEGTVVWDDATAQYYLAVGATGDYSDATTAGSTPGSSAEWQALGTSLPSVASASVFDSSAAYKQHDIVSYNNKLYVAMDNTVVGGSGDPTVNTGEWLELTVYGETANNQDLLTSTNSLSDFLVSDFSTFLQTAATARAQNGAETVRLQSSLDLLKTNQGNLSAARSVLADVDIATESTALARNNILVQSSAAMLAQANASQNVALSLLA